MTTVHRLGVIVFSTLVVMIAPCHAQQPTPDGPLLRLIAIAPNGEIIPGAKILVSGSGEPLAVVSKPDGFSELRLDKPGKYTLTAEHVGFKKTVQEIVVRPDRTLPVRVILIPEKEVFEITDGPIPNDISTNTVEHRISDSEIECIPHARSVTDLF